MSLQNDMIAIRICFLWSDISPGEGTGVTLLCFNTTGAVSPSADFDHLSFRAMGCETPCWKIHCFGFDLTTKFALELTPAPYYKTVLCHVPSLEKKSNAYHFSFSLAPAFSFAALFSVSSFSLGLRLLVLYFSD